MKRVILVILALLLLAGCKADPAEPIPTTEDPLQTAPGIYTEDHRLELHSYGAVRVFPLADNSQSIAFMGNNLLTFTPENEITVLTGFAGPNLTQQTRAEAEGLLLPGDKILRIDQQRIGYYHAADHCVVFLDSGLHETGRTSVPEGMVGAPALSENMATVFYCTESEIRAYSVESGLSRLIRLQNAQSLSVEGVLFEDSVLMCGITDNDGNSYVEFISALTGESLGIDHSLIALDNWQNRYFLARRDGPVIEYIFTAADGTHQCFLPNDALSAVYSLPSMHGVATVTTDEAGIRMDLFDLTNGKKTAELLLDNVTDVRGLTADPEWDAVWFLITDGETGETLLCCWNPELSPAVDDNTYVSPRYTLDNPDTDGLAACREQAAALEERFGIEISFHKDPAASGDYSFTYEHRPEVIQEALRQLEQALSVFPEGFTEIVAEVSDSGKLHIGLVRELHRKNTGVPADVDAIQYWVDGNAWMTLTVGDTVAEQFYHELAHVLDTFVYSKNVSYDEWSKLNPKDFAYDLSYFRYEEHVGSKYLSGKEQAFIDAYSMTYPKEDRARIFDCAIAEGNEALFASKTMQAKLRQFCVGLRNACGWKKDSRSFPWEQYLETPLAYNKK